MCHHRQRAGGKEDHLEQLTPPFGPTYKDRLLDPAVRQAIRFNQRLLIQDLLGDCWRDERTNVRTAHRFLGVHKSYVYNYIRRHGKVTIGAVWDYHRKKSLLAAPEDFDNLAAWSLLHGWPLNAERYSVLRFMRTASAARIAELDLSTAEVTTKALLRWGLTDVTAWRWAHAKGDYYGYWDGKVRKVRVTKRGDGGGRFLKVWRVVDLLDWFLQTSEPIPALLSDLEKTNQDPARNCYRSVALNLKRFYKSPETWDGAINLQRAWSWHWKLMDVAVGHREGETNASAIRLDNYISQSIQALANADPDWNRPAFDTSAINPEKYYPVWVPPGVGARTDVVHVPASVRLIQVLGDGYRLGAEARHAGRKVGLDTGRVTAARGSRIIERPYAYTR